jgi:DNA-binding transcriptional regulator LsrR (DeoR family)
LNDHPWLADHIAVSQTGATEALAQRAAQHLLSMIRTVRRYKQCDEVHVGFAGGMTLRAVAERLARLLSQPHPDNPATLVFHAMVASLDDDDFYADPNSFVTYFITPECRVKVRLVRLPLPGIVESARFKDIQSLLGIESVFERVAELHIIVTSGSLWSDQYSTLRTYIKAAAKRSEGKAGADTGAAGRPDEAIHPFEEQHVIGDLLWQPINERGPIPAESAKYRVTTLMDLKDLPAFIARGGSVLLVMGCSGISRLPKSDLLRTVLKLHRDHNWFTDLVTDTPTLEGVYNPLPRESR